MRVKSLIFLGLLAAAPAGAQEMEDGFPWALISAIGYPEDLMPELGQSARNLPPTFFQTGLAMSQFRSVLNDQDAVVRMVATPLSRLESDALAGDTDFAVQLEETDNGPMGYRIVTAELPVPTSWYSDLAESRRLSEKTAGYELHVEEKTSDDDFGRSMVREINQRSAGRKIEICKAPIQQSLGKRIAEAWNVMLARTHYGKEGELLVRSPYDEGRHDYDFAFHFNNEGNEGLATQLYEGTRPDLLVSTGLAMRNYCKTKDEKYLTQLTTKLAALEKRLPELKRKAVQKGRKS